jgi:hypothetical protein
MDIGMLWFDDSSTALENKIGRAASHYEDKFGRTPTLCLIHPETLNGGEGPVNGLKVRQARTVMPDHFLIGIDEEAESDNGRSGAG